MVKKPFRMVKVKARTRALQEAELTGRATMYWVDIGSGIQVLTGCIYGKDGGHKCEEAAAVTDAVIDAVLQERQGTKARGLCQLDAAKEAICLVQSMHIPY